MISLTYIWHDCFLLRTERCAVVFDFWKDPFAEPERTDCPAFIRELPQELPLYVLVSHHHKDHFTKDIFTWEAHHPEIRFILSHDTSKSIRYMLRPDSVYAGPRPTLSKVTVLRPLESFADDFLHVHAFGSTDIGNSYIVSLEGRNIFHAGDLNAWIWKDESTKAQVAAAIRQFEEKLEPMEQLTRSFDIAMFPVDSRIGRDYFTGASIFVRRFDVRRFIPMHFGLGDTPQEQAKYENDAIRFGEYANPERGEYISLRKPGSELWISGGE